MELALLLQYILSLIVLSAVIFGLSRLKKALLRLSVKLQRKPPSGI